VNEPPETEIDMDAPVTRREMREEFDAFEKRFEAKLMAKMEKKFVTREMFDIAMGAIFARFDDLKRDLKRDLGEDIARHAKATQEYVSDQIRIVDEKYADLPGRVARLEEAEASRRRPRRGSTRKARRTWRAGRSRR
jgi:hypothetical protein